MLHTLFVLVLLFFALFETGVLFLPRIIIFLGQKEVYEKTKNRLEKMFHSFEDGKYAPILLLAGVVIFLLVTIGGSIGSIFFQVGISAYALFTGLGSKLFAVIILALSSYKMYGLTLGAKLAIEAHNHPAECLCELCVAKRKQETDTKEDFGVTLTKQGEDFKKLEVSMLLREIPYALYLWYLLYLIW